MEQSIYIPSGALLYTARRREGTLVEVTPLR